MKLVFRHIILLLLVTYTTVSYAADLLRNPDFEIPSTNVTANATSEILLLNTANSIPGWSFNGTVWYVSNLSLPGKGHAVQLGDNGRINQTFKAAGDVVDYVLTFTLAAQNENCANNHTAVNVSTMYHRSRVMSSERSSIFFSQWNSTRNLWESHAFYLGRWGEDDSIDLKITSTVLSNSNLNMSCWPVVDTITVLRNHLPRWYSDNILANGDFEIGPSFLKNSSEGVLLNNEPERFESPLQEWAILGTIKYIDSKHYKVPHGKAAIQLLTGDPSGIQIDLNLILGSTYNLNFTIGDGNDSCIGNFTVYLQIGFEIMNFTMQSNGTGSAFKHSISFSPGTAVNQGISFNAESSIETYISFSSFNETRRSDGVLCGPVLDNINLSSVSSYGSKIQLYNVVYMVYLIFFTLFTVEFL